MPPNNHCYCSSLTVAQLAVDIALAHNGEIINGDAMQMYDGLPIITNKITPAEARSVPHHLFGNISVFTVPWTVAHFKKEAEGIIKEIRSRGKLPILVGGTHYYTQSLLFEDSIVNHHPEGEEEPFLSREEIEKRWPILTTPTSQILEELRKVDPIMADRWHPKDRRRIQRSLEIYLTLGKRASDIYKEQQAKKAALEREAAARNALFNTGAAVKLNDTLLFWTHADPEVLKTRLDERVDKMVSGGLLEEVHELAALEKRNLEAGLPHDPSGGIWVSIGYKEFRTYVGLIAAPGTQKERIEEEMAYAIRMTKNATRRYANSQVKWIKTKLVTALNNAEVLDHLYLVDGTDVSAFSENCAQPATSITGKFLAGEELPKPEEVCKTAAEMLAPVREHEYQARPDLWVRKTCETCGTVVVSEEQWEIHLASRAHRGRVKKMLKVERNVQAQLAKAALLKEAERAEEAPKAQDGEGEEDTPQSKALKELRTKLEATKEALQRNEQRLLGREAEFAKQKQALSEQAESLLDVLDAAYDATEAPNEKTPPR